MQPLNFRSLVCICATAASVFFTSKSTAEDGLSAADQAQVTALVEKLRSDGFDERESASADLLKLDERFLPALRSLLEKAEAEQRGRLETIIAGIEARVLWARLENIAPGTAVFSTASPDERQDAVIKWAKGTDGKRVVPILVELCGKLQGGASLWGCWDALNFWSNDRAFLARGWGSAWAGGNESVYKRLSDLDEKHELHFSDGARKKCEDAKSPDQNRTADRRTILANQLAVADLGFYIIGQNEVRIVMAGEGAKFWAEWWKNAQRRPEWQEGTLTPEQKAALWLSALESENAAEQIKARCSLIEAWSEPAAQNAIKAYAQKDTPGGKRAKEIIEVTALRNAGKILFRHDTDEIKSDIWVMNPDGSDQQPLKIEGYETKQWKLFDNWAGHLMIRRWDDQSYFWWKPGMRSPQLIAEKEIYNQQLRPGTHQVIYWKRSEEGHEIGSICLFDLDSHQHVALPQELQKGVNYPQVSPDGRWLMFSKPITKANGRSNEACDVWLYDFKNNAVKPLMKSRPHADLSYVGLHWSEDSRWVSCTGFDRDSEKWGALLWIANAETGEIQEPKPVGYYACPDIVWVPGGSMAYLILNSGGKDTPIAAGQYLFRWTPEDGLKQIDIPDAIKHSNHGGNIMHLRPDGRIRISVDEQWLIDPSGKRAPEKTVEEEPQQLTPLLDGWSILSTDSIPGLADEQLVLVSPGGARIPITNRIGPCYYSCFVPGPWPELKP